MLSSRRLVSESIGYFQKKMVIQNLWKNFVNITEGIVAIALLDYHKSSGWSHQ